MKLTLFAALIFISLSGCTHILTLTNNEDKGIKDVLAFYGGYCKYSVGMSTSTEDGTKKYFELEMSKCDVAEKYFTAAPEFPAYGAIYTFYSDLKSESKNYDEIHGVLIFNNGRKYQYSLSRDTLELIAAKMKVFNEIVNLIKTKDFDGIRPLLNSDSYTDSAKTQLISNLKTIDSQFGNVKSFLFYGFRIEKYNDYNVLNILGGLLRDKQDSQLSLKIDMRPSEDKIHFLDYNWFLSEKN